MRIARHSCRVAFCLALVSVLLLALVGIAPPARAAQYEATVTFTAVTTDDTGVTLQGTAVNTGTDAFFRAQVVFWRDRTPITTEDQLSTALAADPDADSGDRIIADDSVATISSGRASFAAGASFDFSVHASWDELNISADGVYLVGVHVRGADVSWASQVTVGRGRTFITLAHDIHASTATVVMLTSAPSWIHDSVFTDDHLAADLGGRLNDLVQLARQPGVSWVIDPALYHEIMIMAGGYSVQTAAGLVDGTGQNQAKNWLGAFSQLDRTNGYRLLWGNPDLALGIASGHDLISTAETAEQANPDLDSLPLLVRTANNQVDDNLLAYVNATQPDLILAEAGGNASVGQGHLLATAALAYPGGPGPDADSQLQQAQRAQAEDAVAATPLIRVITTTADAALASQPLPAWVTTVPLRQIPAPDLWTPGLSLGTPAGPLTSASLDLITTVQSVATIYTSLVQDPNALAPLMALVDSAMVSQSWSADADVVPYATAVQDFIWSKMDGVTLTATQKATLTSRKGNTFPVTVTNNLTVPVYVRITSQVVPDPGSPANLSIPTSAVVTVQPGDKLPLELTPTVLREGQVEAILRLTTGDGTTLRAQAQVSIDAQASSWMGWAVVGSALVLLIVGTFLRVKNRQKHNHQEES